MSRLHRARKQLVAQMSINYAVILLCSLLFAYLLPLDSTPRPIALENFNAQIQKLAVEAHQIYAAEKQHAVEVPASDKEHLTNWLSERLSAEIGLVKLEQLGYQFLGGRLLPSAGKPAALYMYADIEGQRLTLYIRKNDNLRKTSRLRCATSNSQGSICTWQKDKLIYFVIGPAADSQHAAISRLTAKQLHK